MSVRIKEISVKNLGPIDRPVTFDLGLLNLLYGHNETGKTLLVEFLIKSLFKNIKPWELRPFKGSGKVIVEGINDTPMEFSPLSKTKLEDFFDKNLPGLPPDFSKLLVVKGAELEFGKAEGGIDKQIIKQYLSSRGVFEKIEKNIPAVIKKTKIEGTEILGPNQGEIKTRAELGKRIERLNELFNNINNEYSGAYRTELENRRTGLKKEKDELTFAKQHLAFVLSKDIEDIKMKLSKIDTAALDETGSDIVIYKTKLKALNRKREDEKTARLNSRHFQWLKIAKKNYEELSGKAVRGPVKLLLIFTFLSILTSLITMLFNLKTGSLISAGISFILLIFIAIYSLLNTGASSRSQARMEKENLEKDFKNRFGFDLESLTQIEELLINQEEEYNKSEILKKQLDTEQRELDELKIKISNFFIESEGEEADQNFWAEKIEKEKIGIEKLNTRLNKKKVELASLNVYTTDYKTLGNDKTYSIDRFNDVSLELKKIEDDLSTHDNELESLKQAVCNITGLESVEKWEDILTDFYSTRDETISLYNSITADIYGQIMVHEVLEDLRSKEDTKIIESLKSKTIQEPLFELTGRYRRIALEDDQLIVKDDYNDFSFKNLSTGTAEQILLALRIGFGSRLLTKDRLFLILDDAFQYSDWKRRPLSVRKMGELAKQGWQVICFTMDDHIKDLFNKTGKQFGDDFRFFELD
jgi:uncharacterized protein YhaN